MTNLLLYFESGWIKIYELATLSQSSPSISMNEAFPGVETIFYLSHSLVLYPSYDCFNCASFWKINHEGEYGRTQCPDICITSWHVNEYYLISLAAYTKEQHLFFYHRYNGKFQDAQTKFSVANLKNISLSKQYLAIYTTTQKKQLWRSCLKNIQFGRSG